LQKGRTGRSAVASGAGATWSFGVSPSIFSRPTPSPEWRRPAFFPRPPGRQECPFLIS